jgi:hypothetical protein
MRTKVLLVCLVLLPARAWAVNPAVDLVVFDENSFPGHPRGLYDFNSSTATSSLRTTVSGTERFFAMDRRPSDGTVFAVDLSGGLWTLNIDTGAKVKIGDTGISSLRGLAINPLTGDMVVTQAQFPGVILYHLNPVTAVPTQVGFVEVQGGLAFSPTGVLYAFDGDLLYTVNPNTGAAQRVQNPGPAGPLPQNIQDGAFASDGRYFIVEFFGNIAEVNPSTGAGSVLGAIPNGGTLALLAVPEPPAALLLAIGGAAIVLGWRWRTNVHGRPPVDAWL